MQHSADVKKKSSTFPVVCIFECVRMHVWALANVCVVVAGSIEREAGSSRLWAVSCDCCARPQTAGKNQAFPPLWHPHSPLFSSYSRFHFLFCRSFTKFWIFPFSYFLLFPLPPPEALLGSAREQQTESGSLGQLRQQAQAAALWV